MSVSREDVLHVATLARLEFGEADLARMQAELNHILTYVDMLQQLDTGHVEPTAHPFPGDAPMREDRVEPSALEDALLDLAPRRDQRFVVVPRVID